MTTDEKYMARCIELAKKGAGNVSPNPMVGCVIVRNGEIIGEGWHKKCGEAHAEVNAVNSVKNQELLKESTIYVSLEPCSHYGKTPPCCDLIIAKQIPNVVIGTIDPFAKVAGRGIARIKNAGINVTLDVLKEECQKLNKRFFTFHEQKRPYVFLKWAQTKDGFIDKIRTAEEYGQPTWITGAEVQKNVHRMRAEEDAILVGTNTAANDNPSLTVRLCEGKNPLRVVLDRNLKLDKSLHLFDGSTETIVINALKNQEGDMISYAKIDYSQEIIPQILEVLYNKNCLSLIVEGGRQVLQSFINTGLWDEAHIYTGDKEFGNGVEAPEIHGKQCQSRALGVDCLVAVKNIGYTYPIANSSSRNL